VFRSPATHRVHDWDEFISHIAQPVIYSGGNSLRGPPFYDSISPQENLEIVKRADCQVPP
jgi:hypothetical protein